MESRLHMMQTGGMVILDRRKETMEQVGLMEVMCYICFAITYLERLG